MAIYATQQYHDIRDIAARVLPALSPMTTDKEKMVRDNVRHNICLEFIPKDTIVSHLS